VSGVNLGTGENALHPEFRQIVDYLLGRGLRVSLTSNGYSIGQLPDDVLQALHDIEVSVDFADQPRFDAFRGPGAWDTAFGALDRCRRLGIKTTVLAVLMRANHRDMSALAAEVAKYGSPLRVNVYQPVKSHDFAPTYDEFWWAVRDLLSNTTLLACSERVIRAAIGLSAEALKCGSTSIRITPSGNLLPCVYAPKPAGTAADVARLGETVFELPEFREQKTLPSDCTDCPLLAVCGGGCASRRALVGKLDDVDPYCPRRQSIDLSDVVQLGPDGDRLHTGNVCTLLVSG
jgi:radical SAM protein with 4Fe4S-binding SPASM domain